MYDAYVYEIYIYIYICISALRGRALRLLQQAPLRVWSAPPRTYISLGPYTRTALVYIYTYVSPAPHLCLYIHMYIYIYTYI
jgi:hypothetical protein